jgi:hypothetical protein
MPDDSAATPPAEIDQLAVFGLRRSRHILSMTAVFWLIFLLSLAIAILGQLRMIDVDVALWYVIAGFTALGAIISFIMGIEQRHRALKLHHSPHEPDQRFLAVLRSQWEYEQATPPTRRWLDAFHIPGAAVVPVAVFLLVFIPMFQPSSPAARFAIIAGGMAALIANRLYGWYSVRPRRHGTLHGAPLLITSGTDMAGTLKRFRGDKATPVWIVLEPGGYSRADVPEVTIGGGIRQTDHLLMLDVPGGGPVPEGMLPWPDALKKAAHPDARYVGTVQAAAEYLAGRVQPTDAVIALSVLDSKKLANGLLSPESVRPPKPVEPPSPDEFARRFDLAIRTLTIVKRIYLGFGIVFLAVAAAVVIAALLSPPGQREISYMVAALVTLFGVTFAACYFGWRHSINSNLSSPEVAAQMPYGRHLVENSGKPFFDYAADSWRWLAPFVIGFLVWGGTFFLVALLVAVLIDGPVPWIGAVLLTLSSAAAYLVGRAVHRHYRGWNI